MNKMMQLLNMGEGAGQGRPESDYQAPSWILEALSKIQPQGSAMDRVAERNAWNIPQESQGSFEDELVYDEKDEHSPEEDMYLNEKHGDIMNQYNEMMGQRDPASTQESLWRKLLSQAIGR